MVENIPGTVTHPSGLSPTLPRHLGGLDSQLLYLFQLLAHNGSVRGFERRRCRDS
ncbi:MAG: hypothetical protein ABSF25_19650 [Bryobacteraceae bacterium]